MYIKIDGVYRYGVPFFKVGGVWKELWGGGSFPSKEYVKVGGVWKNCYNKTESDYITCQVDPRETFLQDANVEYTMPLIFERDFETWDPMKSGDALSIDESSHIITINKDGKYAFNFLSCNFENTTETLKFYEKSTVIATSTSALTEANEWTHTWHWAGMLKKNAALHFTIQQNTDWQPDLSVDFFRCTYD